MAESTDPPPGLFGSVKRLLETGLALAQNRVELFAVELQEEKYRLVEVLLCTVAVAAFGMMALTLATLAVLVFFWEKALLAALAALSLLYLLATLAAWKALQSCLKKQTAFSETLGEIRKDREWLHTRN